MQQLNEYLKPNPGIPVETICIKASRGHPTNVAMSSRAENMDFLNFLVTAYNKLFFSV